jgi:hypothetical protein
VVGHDHPPIWQSNHSTTRNTEAEHGACELAGVQPEFELLNDQDPIAFTVSANLSRHNLKKGQRAMAWAMLYPEATKLKRRSSETKDQGFSEARLSIARTVLQHSRALAEAVLRRHRPARRRPRQGQGRAGGGKLGQGREPHIDTIAAALASYAKQANDIELEKISKRILARTYGGMGELLASHPAKAGPAEG